MDSSVKITFIIPLYNGEAYIGKCLKSIINQGLEASEYEVLVVNDGSEDEGPRLIQEMSQKYTCIRLINKENGGVSSARNTGMKEAKGEYICFVDADDYIVDNGMRRLIDSLDERTFPDIIKFSSITVDHYFKEPDDLDFSLDKEQTIHEYLNEYGFGSFVWGELIKRTMIEDADLLFENYNVSEDTLFNVLLYIKNKDKRIVRSNANIYRYVVRDDSAVNSYTTKHLQKQLYGNISLFNKITKLKAEYPQYQKQLDRIIDSFRRTSFTRLLAIRWNRKLVKEYIAEAIKIGMFPFNRSTMFAKLADYLLTHQIALCMMQIFYRNIFLPYLHKYVRRN